MPEFNIESFKRGLSKKVTEVNVKTSAFLEINKKKTYISTVNHELEQLQKEAGKRLYEIWKQEGLELSHFQGMLLGMQEKYEVIAEQERQITEIEQRNQQLLGAAGAGAVYCSSCGAANAVEASFCRECGKKLD